MKQPSPHTRALIDRLNERHTLWETLTGSRDDKDLVTEIGDSNEPIALVEILPFVLAGKQDVAAAAAAAVDKLARAVPARDLGWLDYVDSIETFHPRRLTRLRG